MSEVVDERPRRKVLSLKLEPTQATPSGRKHHYVNEDESIYMVFSPAGHMPQRVYGPHEKGRATGHAKMLARETGHRFFVMRAWRAYDPDETEDG